MYVYRGRMANYILFADYQKEIKLSKKYNTDLYDCTVNYVIIMSRAGKKRRNSLRSFLE